MQEKLAESVLEYGTKVGAVSVAIQFLLWPIPFIGPSVDTFIGSGLTASGLIAYMSFDGWRRNRKIKKSNPTS